MIERIEACMTEVLRRQAGHTLSLQRLHDALVAELGSAAGSYHQLHQRLKQTRGAISLRERPAPLIGEFSWPLELREAYSGALLQAGLDLSPLVTLTVAADHGENERGLLNDLEQTLAVLRAHGETDPVLAESVTYALIDLPVLQQALGAARRTTTALRDPHATP